MTRKSLHSHDAHGREEKSLLFCHWLADELLPLWPFRRRPTRSYRHASGRRTYSFETAKGIEAEALSKYLLNLITNGINISSNEIDFHLVVWFSVPPPISPLAVPRLHRGAGIPTSANKVWRGKFYNQVLELRVPKLILMQDERPCESMASTMSTSSHLKTYRYSIACWSSARNITNFRFGFFSFARVCETSTGTFALAVSFSFFASR